MNLHQNNANLIANALNANANANFNGNVLNIAGNTPTETTDGTTPTTWNANAN